MAWAFIYGIVQGALLSILLTALMPGIVGSAFFAISVFMNGASAFTGIIIALAANAAFYFLFSAKAMRKNPMHFYGGALVGFALLFFFGQ